MFCSTAEREPGPSEFISKLLCPLPAQLKATVQMTYGGVEIPPPNKEDAISRAAVATTARRTEADAATSSKDTRLFYIKGLGKNFTRSNGILLPLFMFSAQLSSEISGMCTSSGGDLETKDFSANTAGKLSRESGRERVKKVQLVLTSHSTHIAPEGGAVFIRPV